MKKLFIKVLNLILPRFGYEVKDWDYRNELEHILATLELPERCWVITKVHTTNGYKVGMSRVVDQYDLSMDEELLSEERYTEEEGEIKLIEWCNRLKLPEFSIVCDKFYSDIDYVDPLS
jgi:hypothetical protein